MIPNFVITFREVLEMSLIIGIVLSYLRKTRQTNFNNVVYVAIGAALTVSVASAAVLLRTTNGLTGRAEEIFEGTTMFIGALLLTSMIFWMMKQKQLSRKIQEKVAVHTANAYRAGLFSLVFFSILREGIETVIFLNAAYTVASSGALLGAVSGLAAAVALGYCIFVWSMKINIKQFFTVTSILLILFAAGLIAHGVHEFNEAKLIAPVVENIWNTNGVLDEKGFFGGMAKSLFGYNGNPSMSEVASYWLYLIAVFIYWRSVDSPKIQRKED